MNDVDDILISIRREYVDKILTGEKTIELRRRSLHVQRGTRVWIYSKAPDAIIQVSGVIDDIVRASPHQLWCKYRNRTGVSYADFRSYFGDVEIGCAIFLKDIRRLKNEISLSAIRREVQSFRPPQFYAKLKSDNPTRRVLRASAIHGCQSSEA